MIMEFYRCSRCGMDHQVGFGCIGMPDVKKEDQKPNHNHYFKDVSKLNAIDVYRVLELFEVVDPAIQHAVKKLMCAGGRGHKDRSKDVQEAIDSLNRWQEMRKEDENEKA